jgi:hypothetical protein
MKQIFLFKVTEQVSSDEAVMNQWERSIFSRLWNTYRKMFWGFFTESGTGSLVPVDGMMNSTKYIKILKSRVLPNL